MNYHPFQVYGPIKNYLQMKHLLFAISIIISLNAFPQNNREFQGLLAQHCGKAYEGKIIAGGKEGDGFTGERLIMKVLSCEDNQIKIPFFVGDNKSRTWIFTFYEESIQLKHDHRHEDGSEDIVTMYGGTSPNPGHRNLQYFPADPYTCNLINYACNNIWWVTVDDTSFTYNLRRLGTDRYFSVQFDLTKPIEYNELPWGWE